MSIVPVAIIGLNVQAALGRFLGDAEQKLVHRALGFSRSDCHPNRTNRYRSRKMASTSSTNAARADQPSTRPRSRLCNSSW